MSNLNYDDLLFNFEKCIPWAEIAEVSGKDNLIDEFLMTMKTVGDFCENQVEPAAEENDNNECRLDVNSEGKNIVVIPEAMKRNFETLKELGLFCGVTIPEEHGGFGFPLTAFFGFGEIFSMADSSLGLTPMLNEGCAQVISEYANEKIVSEYNLLLKKRKDLIEIHKGACYAVEKIYGSIKRGEDFTLDRLEESLESIIDIIKENYNIFIFLYGLDEGKDFLVAHSVNVTFYATLTGIALKYSYAKLKELGLGTLLIDAGMVKVPSFILFRIFS